MLTRVLAWAALVIAAVCLVFAAFLIAPADVWEMLVGFAAGTLGTLQWSVLAMVAALLLVSLTVSRPATRARTRTTISIGACAVAIAVVVLVRDNRKIVHRKVSFNADGVVFEGTLYRQRGAPDTKRPAILLLHGSGPVKRDAYYLFAKRFVALGFVVLNVDKRGVGGTSGRYYGDNLGEPVIETRIADARVALEYLALQTDVDTSRVGLFAISQGGWVVPTLLNGKSPARFAVVFSGVTVSSFEEGRWSNWTGENLDHFGFKPPLRPFEELDQKMRSLTPGDFNPRASLAQMTMPSLWLFGEWDSSAPTAASMRVVDTLQQLKIPVTSKVFPEANHGLMVVRGPRGKRNANFTDGVWPAVESFARNRHIVSARTQ